VVDLEKFFDRVNHDKLMAKIAERVGEKRLLKLIRAFLTAGVMENGLVNPVDEGTPQGGPLSPLLSNHCARVTPAAATAASVARSAAQRTRHRFHISAGIRRFHSQCRKGTR
jgi:retron-type reverse transcriptase